MNIKTQQFPSLYVIFTLLSSIRHGVSRRNIWREFRRQGIALKPRLAFWIPLCKQAGLLKETDQQLRVTSHAVAWLNKTPEEQTLSLLEAWQNSPKNKKTRQFRNKLLWKLQHNQLLTATPSCVRCREDHTALNGLDALGITAKGMLTLYGKYFIQSEVNLPSPKPIAPCAIQKEQFIAPLPTHLHLLWRLERYLRPNVPGVYPLHKRALQFNHGDPHAIIQLLEEGLKGRIPDQIKAWVLGQPSIRVTQGIVLEFSSPAELAQLRRQPALRKYFEEFLSSRSVLVSTQNARMLFTLLKRRGVYLAPNEEQAVVKKAKRTHFPQNPVLQPVGKQVSKLALIEKYKQLGQALDMLYRAPGCAPEKRRITPYASLFFS